MNNHLNPNLFSLDVEKKEARQGFGDEIVEIAKKKRKVLVLDADLAGSLRLDGFKDRYKSRFFEMGVSEANMISTAAGLALEGYIPFTTSFAVFTPNQALSQIRVSVAYNKANVKIIGSHAGISTGPDGATHQALEDIATMRAIPNFTVMSPCDYWQTRRAVRAAAQIKGPVYIRFGRGKTPIITTGKTSFEVGKAQVLKEGMDGAILCHGESVYRSLIAAEVLQREEKLDIAVINVHTIKPLDESTILKYAKKCGFFVVTEDHQVAGGLCGAVSEFLSENYPIPVNFVAIRNKFGESGDPSKLVKKYGIDIEDIIESVLDGMKRKKKFWYGGKGR